MIETRAPKKGQGVPKETPSRNSIADLQGVLARHFPHGAWGGMRGELERREFFAAGMQEQVRIMAEVAVALLGDETQHSMLISALSDSPVEKVRGVAAFAVPIVYAGDLERQLQGLYITGALEGTWPRELSATTLHHLIIAHGVDTVLPLVKSWINDPDPAIRRLVVESFRPRGVMLPHIGELKQDPSPLKALLEPLLDDEVDYVRKAIANNLNDVSRDKPELVLAWAEEWMTPEASKERRWIISRALRTLVNAGHPTALGILGFAPPSALKVTWKDTTPSQVALNQLIPFEFEVVNHSDTEGGVILLLVMDEPGKGTARRTSTYQIWKGKLKPGGAKRVSKRIHFIDKSSRPKEPGTYRLIATVNGARLEERTMDFER